jgi:ATP-dependent protease HslVU (ClpYQ) peptidase subunit
MTTIACNKNEMACDLQLTIQGVVKSKGKTKIFKIKANEMHCPEDFIIGLAGDASASLEVVDFFERPEIYKSPPKVRGVSALILTDTGKIYMFDNPLKWIAINTEYASIGSGAQTALGAMYSGATPKEAIKAAMTVDPFTGMGTKSLKF